MKMSLSVRKICVTALMIVVICVCSWITVPFAVPFTMQTFAVFLVLLLLGGKTGTAAIFIYVFMGLAGLPVFSGFQGGTGHLLGPTGGYILGFILIGICYLFAEKFSGGRVFICVAALALGLMLCYLAGTIWFYIVYTGRGERITPAYILSVCVLPYIIPDAAKLALAVYISGRVKKFLP